jgi:hypothetical protein
MLMLMVLMLLKPASSCTSRQPGMKRGTLLSSALLQ